MKAYSFKAYTPHPPSPTPLLSYPAHSGVCNAVSGRGMEPAQSQPVEEALSYSTLSQMKPRTYRNHAWAQLAKSETFYVRGSPEERDLQRRLGLLDEEEPGVAADGDPDLEAQGAELPSPPPGPLLPAAP